LTLELPQPALAFFVLVIVVLVFIILVAANRFESCA
jgi:hypothetical protein